MSTRRHIREAFLIVLIAILAGCRYSPMAYGINGAGSDAHVNPAYTTEAGKKSPLSTIAPMAIAIQVEDHRSQFEQDRLGNKKNGYGQNMGKVVTDKPPTEILYDVLKAEFEANNHTIIAPAAARADALLKVSLKRYWNELTLHTFDFELLATLETDIGIQRGIGQDQLMAKPLGSTFRESRQMAHDGAYEDALRGALAEYVRGFSRDPAVLNGLRSAASLKEKK